MLKMDGAKITGWVITSTLPEAMDRAAASGEEGFNLAQTLYDRGGELPRGKHEFPNGFVVLVD